MNISCSFKIPVCLWLPCNWEWMERKCRTRPFLLLWERFFWGDAQRGGPALPQLEEKPSVSAQCAASLQLLSSKGASRGKTRDEKIQDPVFFFF